MEAAQRLGRYSQCPDPVARGSWSGECRTYFPEEVSMEPRQTEPKCRFRIKKLEERIAPTILLINGAGNTPKGEANGVPRLNPAGNFQWSRTGMST